MDSAADAGVLRGDPAVELWVHGSDDPNGSGFYVILGNKGGAQNGLRLTSGWIELWWHDEYADSASRALDYLQTICTHADALLDKLTPLN